MKRHTALYLLLFFMKSVHNFITSSSPLGYVIDALKAITKKILIIQKTPITSKQPASSRNGRLVLTVNGSQLERIYPFS